MSHEPIKTVEQRLKNITYRGAKITVSTEEFVAHVEEIAELRAAYEALQKELEETRNHQRPFHWRDQNDRLKAENKAQEKRIAELKAAVLANHEWHKTYDEHGGYEDSEMFNINTSALSAQKGTE